MKSHTKLFLFTTLNMRHSKILKYLKMCSVSSLYLIFNKVNRYFEEITGNLTYLTLVPSKLILNKTIGIPNMTIVDIATFLENRWIY